MWLTYLKYLLSRRFDRRRRNKQNPFWKPITLFIYCLRLLFIFMKFYLHQLLLRIYIYAHESSSFGIQIVSICCRKIILNECQIIDIYEF